MSATERITVSEDKLDAKLSALELRLVDRLTQALDAKADATVVRELREKVHLLQSTVQAITHLPGAVDALAQEVAALRDQGNRDRGERDYKRFLWPLIGALVGAAWWLPTLIHH